MYRALTIAFAAAVALLPIGCASMWDAVTSRKFRDAPGCLLEPWAGATVNSLESIQAISEEVPGLRFLIDTGHVAAWGGDLLELLPFAAHVQLRDARRGSAQVAPGDGDVDFAAVLGRLEEVGYEGALSVEYFDLPEHGWPCTDPRADALALRDLVTNLR